MKVVHFTLYSDNPYTRLMYSGLEGQYDPIRGTVGDAILALESGDSNLLHINWEEHAIRRSTTAVEAELVADNFIAQLEQYRKLGGRVVWTVHNELPHELQHVGTFLRLRQAIARNVDRIIVHTSAAAGVLAAQVKFDPSLLFMIPHPSFLGYYEPEQGALPEWEPPATCSALAFGKVRSYKGYSQALAAIADSGADVPRNLRVCVVGEPIPNDPYGAELKQQFGGNPRIELDYRRVPDDEIARLVRSHRCLLLPYERSLTSGVALLGLTLAAPIVAPNTAAMRETLPTLAHSLLFEPSSMGSMLDALRRVMAMPNDELQDLRREYMKRALYTAPARTGARLRDVFESVLEA